MSNAPSTNAPDDADEHDADEEREADADETPAPRAPTVGRTRRPRSRPARTSPQRTVPGIGQVPYDATTWGAVRENPDPRGRGERMFVPGPGGVHIEEWPIDELTAEAVVAFGPGIYKIHYFKADENGRRASHGISGRVQVNGEPPAPPAPPPPAPYAGNDLAAIIAGVEERAERRAQQTLQMMHEMHASTNAQKETFFKGMLDMQSAGFRQTIELMSAARAPAPAATSMDPALLRMSTELAVMRDRQKRGDDRDDDDGDEEEGDDQIKQIERIVGMVVPVIGGLIEAAQKKNNPEPVTVTAVPTPQRRAAPSPAPQEPDEEEDDGEEEGDE